MQHATKPVPGLTRPDPASHRGQQPSMRPGNGVIEVINLIFNFTVSPYQIRRLWRHPGLRIKAQLGEDQESPGACMVHYPTDHRRGVSAGTAGAGGYK